MTRGKRDLDAEVEGGKKTKLTKKKNLIINAFLMGSAGNQSVGIWSHPDDKSAELYQSPKYWTEMAKLLERGKFNACFLADVLGPYDVYQGPGNIGPVAKAGSQWPISDPSYFIPLMASVTSKLAFGITISTISEQPYHLARRLGTLDLISNGRVGWNIVTSYLDSASRNLLNGQNLPSNKERYDRAEEYVDVVYKLFLSSWQDESFKVDKKNGIFTDPNGIRHINHVGEHFNVPGPAITHPSQQKLPVIIQAGTSPKGRELAAKNAELIFLASLTPEDLALSIIDIKKIAHEKYQRDTSKIKFVALLTVIIGDTHELAEKRYEEYKAAYSDEEGAKAMFSGWTGVDIDKFEDDEVLTNVENVAIASSIKKWQSAYPRVEKWTKKAIIEEIKVGGSGPVMIGTASEIAKSIDQWVTISDIDGFNFAYTVLPQSFEEIVDKLLPELRKLGLSWDDYPFSAETSKVLTFREQLFGSRFLDVTHPAHDLSWRSDESRDVYEERLASALEKLKGS
ncbi:LANO_0E16996g1_1 [Lachancea nothofagi CBS 11611]|uniref:LANO_0E16996g1_1 n=1 Tax=Lachancea nothofagi CBS 11611 TaxID=1266666 RepID=A0A1G4K2Q3_9SACH|nr:LANO_0E16996g1_1 [Lachancea nothofagi CBS 11611]